MANEPVRDEKTVQGSSVVPGDPVGSGAVAPGDPNALGVPATSGNRLPSEEALAPLSPTAQTVEEYFRSGWSHYSKKEFYRAESDFQKALEIAPGNADVMYGLGMALQASGRQPEAIKTFERVIQLLSTPAPEEKVRAFMLSRLARGHVNRIKTGDWKLEA